MRQPVEPSDVTAEDRERPLLSAKLLGPVLVTLNGRVVDTSSSRRTRHVLAYLLMHRRSATSRDVLMDTFWPDAHPTAARNSLHVALTGVRRALRPAWPGVVLTRRHDNYRLSDDVTIWVDIDEFSQLCRDGRRADREGDTTRALACYAAADRLYEGDLLADDPYADWASFGRDSLRLDLLDVQRRLSELHAEAGDHASAVLIARRALSIDPCNEPMHRMLMRSYLDTGQLHLALAQFHRCADELWRSYRVRPSPETIELHERLRRTQHAGPRSDIRRTA
jgi:SARP family transcriptional regulator, regulator of embCAB operon